MRFLAACQIAKMRFNVPRAMARVNNPKHEQLFRQLAIDETVSPTRSIDECMALMTNRRLRHLPVVDRKRVVGIVSIGDAVKARLEEIEHEAATLREYIVSA